MNNLWQILFAVIFISASFNAESQEILHSSTIHGENGEYTYGYLLTLTRIWEIINAQLEFQHDLFELFPNPVTSDGILYVRVDERYSPGSMHLQIIDANGLVI